MLAWDSMIMSARTAELIHGEVLLVDQLGPRNGRHPGEELVPRALALAVRHQLQVADGGEEL